MQLHKRQTIEQVRLVLDWYVEGIVTRTDAEAKLGIKRRRFFELLKAYRAGTLTSLAPPKRTNAHCRIPTVVESAIREELATEQRLITNPDLPVRTYNYAAVRDTVAEKTGADLSAQTVRRRAATWGYVLTSRKPKHTHTRVVLTTAAGLLLQHDASHHLWSPYANRKWCLVTTIDDYSRMLLYADFWEEESTWAHMMALKAVVSTYGVGSNYYTDNHSIFRFIERQETYWRMPKTKAGDVKTQWERAVKQCGMGTIYALSPEAKGKVERPYRWLQDRVVRACAKQEVKTIAAARAILHAEVSRYNTRQIHSTTGEIPLLRFQQAEREGNTVFKPLVVPEPYTSTKDIFCLEETRVVNGYSQISWRNQFIKLPAFIPEGATVTLHVIPDSSRPELRVWHKNELVMSVSLAPHRQHSIAAEAVTEERHTDRPDKVDAGA